MKKITIDNKEIHYTGTFTNIQIRNPKGLSLSERVGLISKIVAKNLQDEKH